MASSGTFASTVVDAGGGDTRYIEVKWESENIINTNQSRINWEAYVRGTNHPPTKWVVSKYIVVTINGVSKTLVGGTKTKLWLGAKLGTGSVTVNHASNGSKSVNVSITARIFKCDLDTSTYHGKIYMRKNPVYTLSKSNDAGSGITVFRTSCGGEGSSGTLSSGAKKLSSGDKIIVWFSSQPNYKLTSTKINGHNFSSGNTYTVSGNTSIVSTSTPLKSTISATNSNIDNTSVISINRYSSSYTHTLVYSFKGLTGTIVSKTNKTQINWTVPHIFYSKIPNDLSGTCYISCYTYKGYTCLGSSSCKMYVYANLDTGKPIISATVVDTNNTTKALTGDSSILIRYKSTASCTMTVTPQNYSTISYLEIQSRHVSGSTSGNSIIAKKNIPRVERSIFFFYAKDSRDIYKLVIKRKTMIAYIPLTCNPDIHRTSSTGSVVELKFSGNFYRGSFGAKNNILTLRYRYAEKNPNGSTGTYSAWESMPQEKIIHGTSTYSTETISLDGFHYKKSYIFQVIAKDGSGEYTLTSLSKNINISQGMPVFDWSKDDFNINVPLHVSSIELEASGTNNHAGFHNCIYRGKYLGHEVTDSQYNEISNGTFKDLYIGDYWWRNGRVYRIACFNYYMGYGGSDKVTKPHITLIPDDTIGDKVSMNDTHTTEGGYIGSKMRKTHINHAKGIIKEAFKNHVLNHRQLFTNAVSDEKPSGVVWAYDEVEIPNERMIFGNTLCSASAAVSWHAINRSLSNNQLPLFSLNPNSVACIHPYWLRDITTSTSFALRDSSGYVCKYAAGHTGGIRPVFSIY